jgi:hypothetical protein
MTIVSKGSTATLHAHLALKEAALAKLKYEGAKRTRFRPNEGLLAFLDAL